MDFELLAKALSTRSGWSVGRFNKLIKPINADNTVIDFNDEMQKLAAEGEALLAQEEAELAVA